MEHDLELIIARLEILEIGVCNIIILAVRVRRDPVSL